MCGLLLADGFGFRHQLQPSPRGFDPLEVGSPLRAPVCPLSALDEGSCPQCKVFGRSNMIKKTLYLLEGRTKCWAAVKDAYRSDLRPLSRPRISQLAIASQRPHKNCVLQASNYC